MGAVGASGTAVIAAGVAIPPLAPFLGLVAAGSFYFKLRAKWAKEDPPRPDFEVATEYRPPTLDLMPVMPAGPVPAGAGVPSLLHAAGASLEATVLCVERAMGAATAAQATADEPVRTALAARLREAHEHARRTEMLTTGLRAEWEHIVRLTVQDVPSPEVWKSRFAGRSFAEMIDKRYLARLVATGVDERYLSFSFPAEYPVSAAPTDPGVGPREPKYEVLEEAGVYSRGAR